MNDHVDQYKRCGRCKAEKPLNERNFQRRSEESYKSTSWRSVCIKCQTKRKRELADAAKLKTHKACTTCRQTQPVESFYVCRKNRDGRRATCKTCDALRSSGNPYRGEVNGEKPAAWTDCQHCPVCFGMPWRVAGIRCPHCKLRYAEWPKLELELYTRRALV